VKSGIRDRTSEFIVSENSWPLFLYENYSFDDTNLEKGLFQSKILIQVGTSGCNCEYVLFTKISNCARHSKLYLHRHLLRKKLMAMAMVPTSWKTTGAPGGH
jgi:hypothetical protein